MISLKLIELKVQPACFFGRYLSAMRGLLGAELSPESRSGPKTRACLGLCASLKGDMELYINILSVCTSAAGWRPLNDVNALQLWVIRYIL